MQGMFSVHFVYFVDELVLLIVAVCINSYYLLLSMNIALRVRFVLLWQHVYCYIFALLLCTSPSVFISWTVSVKWFYKYYLLVWISYLHLPFLFLYPSVLPETLSFLEWSWPLFLKYCHMETKTMSLYPI